MPLVMEKGAPNSIMSVQRFKHRSSKENKNEAALCQVLACLDEKQRGWDILRQGIFL
jgi:hypothetical protein